MIIRLEDRNDASLEPLYVGERRRLASATGVAFVGDRRLVASSLAGRCMYLIEFDLESQRHEVVSSTPTTSADSKSMTDLVDFDGTRMLVTSNCDDASFSLYELQGDHIAHVRDVDLPGCNFCHGTQFGPAGSGLVVAASIRDDRAVHVVALDSDDETYVFSHHDWIPRDACFVSETRLVVPYSRNYPGSSPSETVESGLVALFELDLANRRHELVAEAAIDGCRFESCVYAGGRLFVVDQSCDRVIEFSVEGDSVTPEYELVGYDFPHGSDFDASRGLLAVTNYGSNTVVLTAV